MDPIKQRLIAGLAAFSVGITAFPHAGAAETKAPVKLTGEQMQSLGIKTMALPAPLTSGRNTLTGRVVAAPGSQEVVSSPIRGLVTQLYVQPFQAVRTGAPLLRLSSPELGQLQLQLLQAQSRTVLAQQTAKREDALVSEGIIAQRRAVEAQAALREAEAALQQAKSALRLSGMSSAAIDGVAKSGVPQDAIMISAPRAATVTEIEVKAGQRVEAATALLQLSQVDALAVEIQIPVAESANWPVGGEVELPDGGAKAKITGVSPVVAPNSQMALLRATLNKRGDKGRTPLPGELVSVVLSGARAAGWEVPQSAVIHDGPQAYVFVQVGDAFEARAVTVSQAVPGQVRVSGPLKAAEQIAVSGLVALKAAWLNPAGGK